MGFHDARSRFPTRPPLFELPIHEEVIDEVHYELDPLGSYIALNLDGSAQKEPFQKQ